MKHLFAILLLLLALAGSSCDFDDDDDYNRPVPPGLGSMLIDNETYDDISVFIDGQFDTRVAREDKVTAYDLAPGVYRVVLEQRGGRRNFRDDIDILEGTRTVLEVFEDSFDRRDFDVVVFFD